MDVSEENTVRVNGGKRVRRDVVATTPLPPKMAAEEKIPSTA